jgi:hypothetical protein
VPYPTYSSTSEKPVKHAVRCGRCYQGKVPWKVLCSGLCEHGNEPSVSLKAEFEDVGRSGFIDPLILNFGNRWRWVVSFRLRLPYPRSKAPFTHCMGLWVGLRAGSDVVAKRNVSATVGNWTSVLQPVASHFTYWCVPDTYKDRTKERRKINSMAKATPWRHTEAWR